MGLGWAIAPGLAGARTERVTPIGVPEPHRVIAGFADRSGATRPDGAESADAAALDAYHVYLEALAAGEATSAARDSQLVQGVDGSCANALTDVSRLTAGQLKRSAMADFGDELDADLDLAYMAPARPALNQLASALTGLNWSTAAQSAIPARLIRAEHAMLNLAQSDICADANTLDAAPLSEPPATSRFLHRYRVAAGNLQSALSAFQSLLARYETAAERKPVSQIDELVTQFSAQSTAAEQSAASTTLSDLGIAGD